MSGEIKRAAKYLFISKAMLLTHFLF